MQIKLAEGGCEVRTEDEAAIRRAAHGDRAVRLADASGRRVEVVVLVLARDDPRVGHARLRRVRQHVAALEAELRRLSVAGEVLDLHVRRLARVLCATTPVRRRAVETGSVVVAACLVKAKCLDAGGNVLERGHRGSAHRRRLVCRRRGHVHMEMVAAYLKW